MKFENIRAALSDGLLSFPITDMDSQGNFNEVSFAERLKWFASHEISTVFVAGGTGEFFSLSKDEYKKIVRISKETVKHIPVISSVGRSIPDAIEYAKIAEEAGIDGLLLMPPYLTECPKDGTMEYAAAIISSTSLPVIYYNRGNGILTTKEIQILADRCENLIGLKDGVGNMQDLNDIIKCIGNRLVYIGGVPTAEIISEAYLSIGVHTYSSAVFNFVPSMAVKYYKALRAGDKVTVDKIIREFFVPFVRLRSKKSGYAVSLVKAGAKLVGRNAGDVRPPLAMPTEEEIVELKRLINVSYEL
ncbi:MAG: 5-dehydro-4-deoxyglucarate dehydratase [Bacteroidia bacterium]|nr:5-dehydro-4-deoxyglucarate dehydratase [Bacteroidia bacterium]